MTKIICLANSRKNSLRCIAGVAADGRWIRPVSGWPDGGIAWSARQIEKAEPLPLDVLRIPLDESGPDFGHQPENRSILNGAWLRTGSVTAGNVRKFCQTKDVLLHTDTDRVPARLVAGMRAAERYSLQLIYVEDAAFYKKTSFKGNPQYRATFTYAGKTYDIVITDPLAENRLAKREMIGERCILTVSMGGPYDGNYFKFVAAVIWPV